MARPQAVTVSTDKSGRTIYCVGAKYFYTRSKAEDFAEYQRDAANERAGSAKAKKATKSRKPAAKTRGTSTASDAYHWLHAGRRNPANARPYVWLPGKKKRYLTDAEILQKPMLYPEACAAILASGPKRNPHTGRFVRKNR